MNEWLSSRSGATAHLDVEELATLLEGNLSAERTARLRQHIAECEDCHELFVISAEAVEEMEEPEAGLPAAEPAAPQYRRLVPLAFAAVAALAVFAGFLVYRQLAPSAGFALAQVIAPLQNEDAQVIGPRSPVHRGSGEGIDQQRLAFGLGVESVHLALQQRAGDRVAAGETLAKLKKLWSRLDGMEGDFSPFDAGLDKALERLEEARRRNAQEFFFDQFYFDLGLWTEAGRLAAASGRDEYFQGAFHNDMLATLLPHEAELGPQIRTIQRRGSPEELQAAFQAIREANDPRW